MVVLIGRLKVFLKVLLEVDMGQDVTAALLGTARKALERTLGIAADDDLLDSIFSRFCVGK